MLAATLESTADGIHVVDHDGRIVSFNSRFKELWNFPPDVLDTHDDKVALRHVLSLLSDPDAFTTKVASLYADPEAEPRLSRVSRPTAVRAKLATAAH